MRNVTRIKDSNIHNRLYNEHVAHAQRRSSIYDPERKDKEDENFNCTFQPYLEKTQYRHGSIFTHNNRSSLTSTCFNDMQNES